MTAKADLTGYPLKEALRTLENRGRSIIEIVRVEGTNKKFNDLTNPYVIRQLKQNESVTLFVSYY